MWPISFNLEICLEIWSANLECVFETLSLQKKEIEHLMLQDRAIYVLRASCCVWELFLCGL